MLVYKKKENHEPSKDKKATKARASIKKKKVSLRG